MAYRRGNCGHWCRHSSPIRCVGRGYAPLRCSPACRPLGCRKRADQARQRRQGVRRLQRAQCRPAGVALDPRELLCAARRHRQGRGGVRGGTPPEPELRTGRGQSRRSLPPARPRGRCRKGVAPGAGAVTPGRWSPPRARARARPSQTRGRGPCRAWARRRARAGAGALRLRLCRGARFQGTLRRGDQGVGREPCAIPAIATRWWR